MPYSDRLRSRAHRILDDVKYGKFHSLVAVNWALRVLGDLGDAVV